MLYPMEVGGLVVAGGGEKGCETRRVERLADAFYGPIVPAYMCGIPWRVGGGRRGGNKAVRQGDWKG